MAIWLDMSTENTLKTAKTRTKNQRPDICNSNLAIKKPDDDEVVVGGEDYKSQILPNFQINCLRTLLRESRKPSHLHPPTLVRS